jgi:dihydrofolate reductase
MTIRTSVFVGTSVDGFIARPDGAFDFLPDDGTPHGYEEFIATVDALVMGRNTFDVVMKFPVWPYGAGKPVFVLSSRPLPQTPVDAVVEQLRGEPAEIVEQLAARGFQHLYIDGGLTIQQFLRAGLIDRITITRVPVLIGEGISLFGSIGRDVQLRHVATRSFANGFVQSEYEVIR